MHDELTQVDIDKMKEELQHRIQVLRPQLIEEVKVARSFGDLSENFEYKAAKREKNRNDSRIRYLENMIKTAVVIDGTAAGDGVALFDKVTFYLEEEETEETIQLVTTLRQDALKGLISKESLWERPCWAIRWATGAGSLSATATTTTARSERSRKQARTRTFPSAPFENSQPPARRNPGQGAFWVRFLLRTRSRKGRQAKGKGSCKGALGQISRETGTLPPRRSQCTGYGRG